MAGRYQFVGFWLDPDDRVLRRGDVPLEVNGRYLDALILLLREAGRLVSKDRFLDEVWRGMPVTEEALTQCIRTLRRQLGDDAASPRFIATVPKHGYRFIAPVDWVEDHAVPGAGDPPPPSPGSAGADEGASGDAAPAQADERSRPSKRGHAAAAANAGALPAAGQPTTAARLRDVLLLAAAGTAGAGIAGLAGGVCYGFAAAAQPLPGTGALSVLLILVCLTVLAALMGGAGVALGIAATALAPGRPWRWAILGGATGGMLVGAVVKLLGLDAFSLIVGRSPGDITGAMEGLLLGAAVGGALWLAHRGAGAPSLRRRVSIAALVGGVAGIAIPLLGGRLMGGSLALLARSLPASRLRLDAIGRLFGETGLGPVSLAVTGALEGALFAACIVAAMEGVRRHLAAGGRLSIERRPRLHGDRDRAGE